MPRGSGLIPFKKGKEWKGNRFGRPRKLLTQIEAIGYSKGEVQGIINAILALSVDEVKNIAENNKADVLERTIARALIKSFEKGSLYSIDNLLSRSHGKPTEMVDIQAKEQKVVIVQYGNGNNPIQSASGATAGVEQSGKIPSADVWEEVREIPYQSDHSD